MKELVGDSTAGQSAPSMMTDRSQATNGTFTVQAGPLAERRARPTSLVIERPSDGFIPDGKSLIFKCMLVERQMKQFPMHFLCDSRLHW
jgi:hypothetical protein